uniref:Uncharacterized protein n=1 Tax=Molossus molossus TaxID=27622 RepID=A0A7J8GM30_MOLMO|nr:hypothetical protein HJG59_011542 [Molossus molossus]
MPAVPLPNPRMQRAPLLDPHTTAAPPLHPPTRAGSCRPHQPCSRHVLLARRALHQPRVTSPAGPTADSRSHLPSLPPPLRVDSTHEGWPAPERNDLPFPDALTCQDLVCTPGPEYKATKMGRQRNNSQ